MDSPSESITNQSSNHASSPSSPMPPLAELSLSSPPVIPPSSSFPTQPSPASTSGEKHVHFAPEVDEQLKQRQLELEESTEDEDILYSSNELNSDKDKNDNEVKDEEEDDNSNGITINVIEFCPEDIQSSTFKRLFIRVYKFR